MCGTAANRSTVSGSVVTGSAVSGCRGSWAVEPPAVALSAVDRMTAAYRIS